MSYQRLRVALARMIKKDTMSQDKTLDTTLSSIWPPDRGETPDRSWYAVPERNEEGIPGDEADAEVFDWQPHGWWGGRGGAWNTVGALTLGRMNKERRPVFPGSTRGARH